MEHRKEPLVSIITPCYNGGEYLSTFLDSIVNQSYLNIEFIFINDGSTDDSETIVLAYKEAFKKAGIRFIYLFQENKGQAAALNQGLAIFQGEYLTWPDADDVLDRDNIRDRVAFLENNSEYNVVLCDSVLVNTEGTILKQIRRAIPKKTDTIFQDLINEENIYFAGGAYMIRSSAFLRSNPNRHIYESRGGQNWQMLLPVLYSNRCGYLQKPLYHIVEHLDSHSRALKTLDEHVQRTLEHEAILVNTIKCIDSMSHIERLKYLQLVEKKYASKRFRLATRMKDKSRALEFYKELKKKKFATFKDLVHLWSIDNYFFAGLVAYRNYLKKRKQAHNHPLIKS